MQAHNLKISVQKALKFEDQIQIYENAVYSLARGNNLLDIPAYYLLMLKSNQKTQKQYALNYFIPNLIISTEKIDIVCNDLYDFILKGLKRELDKLDLPYHFTVEKIENFGYKEINKKKDSSKNQSIRYYLTQILYNKGKMRNNKTLDAEQLDMCKNVFSDYALGKRKIKSIPLSFIYFENRFRYNEDKTSMYPDVEAKRYLKMLLSESEYEKIKDEDFVVLTMIEYNLAVIIKDIFVKSINKYLGDKKVPTYFVEDFNNSINIDHILSNTTKGLIKDKLSYIENLYELLSAKDVNEELTQEEIDMIKIMYKNADLLKYNFSGFNEMCDEAKGLTLFSIQQLYAACIKEVNKTW